MGKYDPTEPDEIDEIDEGYYQAPRPAFADGESEAEYYGLDY